MLNDRYPIAAFAATIAATFLTQASSQAAINLSTASGVVQDFDSLPASGTTTGLFTGTGTSPAAVPGTSGYVGARIGGTGSSMNFIADDGTLNTGAIYSYGTTGTSDRALGAVASGTNIGGFGAEYVNDTGSTIDSFTLSVDREQWRSSTSVANTFAFAYGISGGANTSSNFVSSAGMTALSTFDLVGDAPVTTNAAVNGNTDVIHLTGSIAQSLAPGASLFIRWNDVNDAGNDAGLAIDNVNLTAVSSTPEPASLSLATLGGVFALARRRSAR